MPDALTRLIKGAAAIPQDDPGATAMQSAAELAKGPAGMPLLKLPKEEPGKEDSSTGQDAIRMAHELDSKTKEINGLRQQLQESKFDTMRTQLKADIAQEQTKMRESLHQEQQRMHDKIRAEQKELDKRQSLLQIAEAQHKANNIASEAEHKSKLAVEQAQHKAQLDSDVSAHDAEIAQHKADSLMDIAQQTTDMYVKQTEKARTDADKYWWSQDQKFKENHPAISPALQSRLDGAMASVGRVGKSLQKMMGDPMQGQAVKSASQGQPQAAGGAPLRWKQGVRSETFQGKDGQPWVREFSQNGGSVAYPANLAEGEEIPEFNNDDFRKLQIRNYTGKDALRDPSADHYEHIGDGSWANKEYLDANGKINLTPVNGRSNGAAGAVAQPTTPIQANTQQARTPVQQKQPTQPAAQPVQQQSESNQMAAYDPQNSGMGTPSSNQIYDDLNGPQTIQPLFDFGDGSEATADPAQPTPQEQQMQREDSQDNYSNFTNSDQTLYGQRMEIASMTHELDVLKQQGKTQEAKALSQELAKRRKNFDANLKYVQQIANDKKNPQYAQAKEELAAYEDGNYQSGSLWWKKPSEYEAAEKGISNKTSDGDSRSYFAQAADWFTRNVTDPINDHIINPVQQGAQNWVADRLDKNFSGDWAKNTAKVLRKGPIEKTMRNTVGNVAEKYLGKDIGDFFRGNSVQQAGRLVGGLIESIPEDIANSWSSAAQASDMAKRRGVSRGFLGLKEEGPAVENARRAIQQRHLAEGWGRDAGNIGTDAAIGLTTLLTGGTGGLALRGAGTAGKVLRAAKTARNARRVLAPAARGIGGSAAKTGLKWNNRLALGGGIPMKMFGGTEMTPNGLYMAEDGTIRNRELNPEAAEELEAYIRQMQQQMANQSQQQQAQGMNKASAFLEKWAESPTRYVTQRAGEPWPEARAPEVYMDPRLDQYKPVDGNWTYEALTRARQQVAQQDYDNDPSETNAYKLRRYNRRIAEYERDAQKRGFPINKEPWNNVVDPIEYHRNWVAEREKNKAQGQQPAQASAQAKPTQQPTQAQPVQGVAPAKTQAPSQAQQPVQGQAAQPNADQDNTPLRWKQGVRRETFQGRDGKQWVKEFSQSGGSVSYPADMAESEEIPDFTPDAYRKTEFKNYTGKDYLRDPNADHYTYTGDGSWANKEYIGSNGKINLPAAGSQNQVAPAQKVPVPQKTQAAQSAQKSEPVKQPAATQASAQQQPQYQNPQMPIPYSGTLDRSSFQNDPFWMNKTQGGAYQYGLYNMIAPFAEMFGLSLHPSRPRLYNEQEMYDNVRFMNRFYDAYNRMMPAGGWQSAMGQDVENRWMNYAGYDPGTSTTRY